MAIRNLSREILARVHAVNIVIGMEHITAGILRTGENRLLKMPQTRAYTARNPLAMGIRTARTAGNRPPIKPMIVAHIMALISN